MRKTTIPREFLGAFKAGHRPSARSFIDEEFSFKLLKQAELGCEESKQALKYLTQFNNEYHKDVFTKGLEPLNNNPEFKKDCTARANARRRDLYTYFLKIDDDPSDFTTS